MLVLQATTRSEIERRSSTYVSADLVPEATEQVLRMWLGRSIAALREHISENAGMEVHGPDLFKPNGLVPRSGGDDAHLQTK